MLMYYIYVCTHLNIMYAYINACTYVCVKYEYVFVCTQTYTDTKISEKQVEANNYNVKW